MAMIDYFFFKTVQKRKEIPSPSSRSESENSPANKRLITHNQCDSFEDSCSLVESPESIDKMSQTSLAEALQQMQRSLQKLATKDDIRTLSSDVQRVSQSMSERYDVLEARPFEIQHKKSKERE